MEKDAISKTVFLITMDEIHKITHIITQQCKCKKIKFFLEQAMKAKRGSRGTRAVRKVSSHFEYLESRSCGLDVT